MTAPDLPDLPTGRIDRAPQPLYVEEYVLRELLDRALADHGVQQGVHDEKILRWLAGWGAATVITVASWPARAHKAGYAAGYAAGLAAGGAP